MKRLLVAFIIAVPVALIGLFISGRNTCNRDIPNVPIYPGSELIEQENVLNSPQAIIVDQQYEVEVNPNSVIEFYQNTATCQSEIINDAITCRGDGEPRGTYYVRVSYESQITTHYSVEIGWDTYCNTEWAESIE